MADSVEVKLGADTSEATRGADDAATRIAGSLDAISKSLENFSAQNRKMMEEVTKAHAQAASSFAEFKNNATGAFNSIIGGITAVRSAVIAIGSVLAGGMLGKEAVASLTGLANEVRGLQITMGMGSEAATKLAVNLKLAGIEAATFEQMAFRVGMRIKSSSEDFDKLGVTIRNSAGELLPTEEILQNIYKRMLDFRPGSEQMVFALATVGRNAKDFASDMEMLNATNARAAQLMEQLGIEAGPARQGQVRAYQVEVRAFGVALGEVGSALGAAMLPNLEKLAAWLVSVGPSAIRNVSIAFGIFTDAISIVVEILKNLWANLMAVADAATFAYNKLAEWLSLVPGMHAVGNEAKSILDTLEKYSTLASPMNWVAFLLGMEKTNEETTNKIVSDTQDMFRRLKALTADYSEYENDAWAKIERARAGAAMGIPSSGKNLSVPDLSKGGGADDQMAKFKAELDDMNLANGAFLQLSKQNEMEFWEEKLSLVRGKGAEEVKLRQEITREILRARNAAASEEYAADVASFQRRIAAAKDNEAEQMMLVRAFVEFEKAINGEGTRQYEIATAEKEKIEREWVRKKQEIDRENQKNSEEMLKLQNKYTEEYLNQEVAMGRLSVLQKLAIETDLENSLYAEELRGLDLYIATLTEGTLEYAKALNQRKKLTAEHEIELTKIANAAELERQKYALEAEDAIRSSMADTISKLVSNTQNWKKTLLDAFKALDEALVRIAANKVVNDLFGAGTKGGGILGGIFGKIFGASPIGTPPINPNDTAEIGAQTANTAAITTNTAIQTTAEVSITANTTALVALTTAVAANTAALAVSSASSSLGGFSSAFSGIAELPFLDSGSSFVPHDMVAVVHRGEAVIPAAMNKPGGFGQVNMRNMFMFNGPVDTRTQYQIAAQTQRAAERAMKRSR